MRVLHLFNVFGATTEKAMLDYTRALGARGWDLTAGYETVEDASRAGPIPLVQLRRVAVEPTGDVPAQMRHVAANVTDPAMRRLLEGEPFDLVHGHFGPRVLQGAAWLARGVPMVVSLYGYDVARLLRDPCWAERYQWAAAHGATFVVLARYMQDKLLGFGIASERVRLVRLGVNLAEHAYDPQPAERPVRFVFVGRLVEKKGADVLIEAMDRLARDMPEPVTLDLIGDGPMRDALQQRVAEAGLAGRVRFLGTLPFHELFARLRGAAALVQPSVVASDGDSEGAPMVLMHAQASGVPCVTTAHSGNPEVLPPLGQRFVAPERDPDALAHAMRDIATLASLERRVLQHAGRRWIERHFDVNDTVAGYDALYRELTRPTAR